MSVLLFCGKSSVSRLRDDVEIIKTHRHLPHWQRQGAVYWITFRLADSLPQSRLKAFRHERDIWLNWNPKPWTPETEAEYQTRYGERLENWLDTGYGSCALKRSDCRNPVRSCLLKFQNQRLCLHHGVIMPNHVHLLIQLSHSADHL